MFEKLKTKARELKKSSIAVYYAMLDKRTPTIAKIFAAITLAYLMSPIDLIPDFIPVLGILDDLILVPIMLRITVSLIPEDLFNQIKAEHENEKLPKKWYFAVPIVLIYLLLCYWIFRKVSAG